MKNNTDLANEFFQSMTDEIYCNLPCQIEAVNGNYVDVTVFINDEEPNQTLYNIPIQREETGRAYVFLGIKKGDFGTLKFFDRDTSDYIQSFNTQYNGNEEQHSINHRCFELGFVPDSKNYVYPNDKEIVIGLKNQKFTLSVDNDGKLNITSQNDVDINITGNVTQAVTGNVTQSIEGNISQDVTGDVTQNISGNANIIATNVNTNGILTHTGNVTINGTLTATTIIAQNGSTGTYANQVTTASGIVVSGS